MTIEYNGFEYAGFQRQTATHIDTSSCNHQRSNKKARKSKRTSSTIQHEIEMALQQYTNLSIATLRVRGAGRTDKGVHATGQVTAFDIPLELLNIDDNNCIICAEDTNSKEEGDINKEILSKHCMKHIQDAYHILNKHISSTKTTTDNDKKTNDKKNTATFIDLWQIRRALSTRLPTDIVIQSIRLYTDIYNPFEPRNRIQCKTYMYNLRFRCLAYLNDDDESSSNEKQSSCTSPDTTNRAQLHPICNSGPHLLRRITDQNTVWLCQWPLNPSLIRQACNMFVGKHNFVNFVHKDERKKTNSTSNAEEDTSSDHVIDLFEFSVDIQSEEEEDTSLPPVMNATFTLKAKGFHRSMVRLLVGFVVDVARGKQRLEDIPILLLDEKEEDVIVKPPTAETLASLKVHAAPACGLCLTKVEYEHDNFL